MSACIWFPQYMKNLEIEADKANQHLEQTLLPKVSIEELETEAPSTENTEEKESEKEDDEEKKDK